MPVLDHWELPITTDDVIRAQGADPEILRARRPALITATEQAINRGLPILKPLVLYETFPVKSFTHERLDLAPRSPSIGKYSLSGPLVAQHLAKAREITIIVCTIGGEIDEVVSSLFKVDPLVAMALDGVGSAAVELLAIQACNYFEQQAKSNHLNTSLPLNPGMIGWPVEVGQPQIFSLVDSEEIGVTLTDSWMMVPNKTLSQVLGTGPDLSSSGSYCEYCSLKGVCRYQNHYAGKS